MKFIFYSGRNDNVLKFLFSSRYANLLFMTENLRTGVPAHFFPGKRVFSFPDRVNNRFPGRRNTHAFLKVLQ